MKAVFVLTCALSSIALGESAIPAAFNRDRYEQTFSDSPFATATPKEDKVEEPANDPLSDLVVTGMGKLDDGRSFVIVQRVGDEGSMRFEGTDKNREGLSVKEVKWGEKWSQSVVTMSFEGRSKTVNFKENSAPVAAAPPPQPGGGRGPNPGVNAPPPIVPTGLNTAARPTGPQRQPGITPTIPRPGGSNFQVPRPGGTMQQGSLRGGTNLNTATPQAGPQPTNGGAPRNRVRSINNR